MSVFSDLCAATKFKPKAGESYEDFAERVHKKVNAFEDDEWKDLSRDGQDWNNKVVPIFERRVLAVDGGMPMEEVPPMEGYEPAEEAETGASKKVLPSARRRPQKPSPAKRFKPSAEPKPDTSDIPEAGEEFFKTAKLIKPKPMKGNSGAVTAASSASEDLSLLELRVAILEAHIVSLANLFATIGGNLLDGVQSARKIPSAIVTQTVTNKVTTPTMGKTPKASGRQPRAGGMLNKIAEVLAKKPLTTAQLLEHFKIGPDASNSFRQRLAQMTKAGRIANKGRGEPWQLVK